MNQFNKKRRYHNNIQRRKLKTFGLFSKRHWLGLKPDDSFESYLYYKLKKIGFSETIWQYVFVGQKAGLVYPLDNGKGEIHVRFYDDTVEAELEIGRNYLTHFYKPRYQGEYLVFTMLEEHLSDEEKKMVNNIMRDDINKRTYYSLDYPTSIGFIKIIIVCAIVFLILSIVGIINYKILIYALIPALGIYWSLRHFTNLPHNKAMSK